MCPFLDKEIWRALNYTSSFMCLFLDLNDIISLGLEVMYFVLHVDFLMDYVIMMDFIMDYVVMMDFCELWLVMMF